MIRGSNHCQLEENVITGVPDYFYPLTFNMDSQGLIWSESKKAHQKRHDNSIDATKLGGGIDPTTGYTRRVMSTMSWVDYNRPVNLDNLPDMSDWVAGLDASPVNRLKYANSVGETELDLEYNNETIYTIIVIIGILLLFLIISFIAYAIINHHPNN